MTNFHTHTFRCKHGLGIPSDYVKAFSEDFEMSSFGFSDHCPYPDDDERTWPEIRMSCTEIPAYLEDIEKAKELANFPVYSGFECEWDKEFSGWYTDILKKNYNVDYLVFGPHWVRHKDSFIYALNITDKNLLFKYIDGVIEGIHSKIFDFVAHPDLVLATWKNWDTTLESCMQEIILASNEEKLPLEINGLGTFRPMNVTSRGLRYQYPVEEFWQLAKKLNATVICNGDCHNPLEAKKNVLAAHTFAKNMGIKPIESLF
ncbi:MAG: histidinol-phosphatase [Spirochaetaceae bacterium]|nr:histidinol-phosphatase [Spirochaetaceae bacterium]